MCCFGTSMADLTDKEKKELSDQMRKQIVKVNGPVENAPQEQLFTQVFYSMVNHAQRQNVDYRLQITGSNQVNAYALPDGRIVAHKGILDLFPAGDLTPMAYLAGHEIAHVERQHAARKAERGAVSNTIIGLLVRRQSGLVRALGGVASNLISSGYSRDLEAEADRDALIMMKKAGYDTSGALVAMKVLWESQGDKHSSLFPTHPHSKARYDDAVAWIEKNDPASNYQAVLAAHQLRDQIKEIRGYSQTLAASTKEPAVLASLSQLDQACSAVYKNSNRSVAIPETDLENLGLALDDVRKSDPKDLSVKSLRKMKKLVAIADNVLETVPQTTALLNKRREVVLAQAETFGRSSDIEDGQEFSNPAREAFPQRLPPASEALIPGKE